MFRRRKGIRIPYEKQGLIYFTLLNYEHLARDLKDKIDRLCAEIGKEDEQALMEVLITDNEIKTVEAIAREYFTNEKKLYMLRAAFYEQFEKEL